MLIISIVAVLLLTKAQLMKKLFLSKSLGKDSISPGDLDRACCRTDELLAREILITRAHGHVGRALEDATVELVDHERLEGVADRVDVVDPAEPDHHVARRDGETWDVCQRRSG